MIGRRFFSMDLETEIEIIGEVGDAVRVAIGDEEDRVSKHLAAKKIKHGDWLVIDE